MKRGLTVTVAAAAILVVGLSGCSSNKSSTGSSRTSGATTSAGGGGGASGTKVIIDGKDQNLSGSSVKCTNLGGEINIAILGSRTSIDAVLSDADPPEVKQVGLGDVGGVELGYNPATGQGKASATKIGSTYKITGTATGLEEGNTTQAPFEIDVTCP